MKNYIISTEIVLIIIAFLGLPFASLSQSGSLDLSFGVGGKVTTPIGLAADYGRSAELQNDGKIIVVGYSYNGTDNDFAIVRYNTDGSLDTTFNSTGKATTAIGASDDRAYDAIIQNDGKIIVAGYSYNGTNNDYSLVRYNTDGSLDSFFDTDGKVMTAVGSYGDTGQSVTLQNDGKIVVTGYSFNSTNNDVSVVRYNTDGSLDTTFDTDGKVITNIAFDSERGYNVVMQSDGKIVVGGLTFSNSFSNFLLIRYNTNGSLDTTFDTDGKVITNIGIYDDVINDLTLQSDGKIIATGYSTVGPRNNFAIARYNTNGSLDTTFDEDGIVLAPIGISNDWGQSAVIQSDDKIVIGGYSYDGVTNDNFAILRLNNNGGIDTAFGNNGSVYAPVEDGADQAFTVLLQNDGKIVLAGFSANDGSYDFAVARYNNDVNLGVDAADNTTSTIKMYPNPFNTSVTIETSAILDNATLTVYNIYGQEVKQINNLTGHIIAFNRGNLTSGLYFIQLNQDNKILTTNKLVIAN